MGATSRERMDRTGPSAKVLGRRVRNVSIAGTKLTEWRRQRKRGERDAGSLAYDEREDGEGQLYRRTRIAETRQFVARASVNLLP